MCHRTAIFWVLLFGSACSSLADEPKTPKETPLIHCGERNSPPIAASTDGGSRKCGAEGKRNYTPRHSGLGFEILDAESKACFVPDEEYRLLDDIVDTVERRVTYDPNLTDQAARLNQAKQISKTISSTLTDHGFALYIPTDTLGDALVARNSAGEPERHVFDCDTGSFIFLTVTDNLRADVFLVEISLPSGAGHNYVRWDLGSKKSMDWDMNAQSQCLTPSNLPSYQGRSMSRQETIGYTLSLRAKLWETRKLYDLAIADFRKSMSLYPQAPLSYNNFAWMIATRDVPDRSKLAQEALSNAQRAVTIERSANYLDTLSCVYALLGDFSQASIHEKEALQIGFDAAFQRRLGLFSNQKDCTGEE